MDHKAAIIADIKQVTGDYTNLITKPLPELLKLAKELGIKSNGSKSKIIGRILNHQTLTRK